MQLIHGPDEETLLYVIEAVQLQRLSRYMPAANNKKSDGGSFSSHHVVSPLTFGFWQHLLTRRFERLLWPQGIHVGFPNAPSRARREDVYLLVESVRRWRNRIAHQQAIFDKSPMKKHQDALDLIGWCCGPTGAWVSSVSRVPRTIELRPL
ncbi:MAG: hypothetical protein K2Y29_12080 [Beijerinckiaceae bacterium]|nr:hypothetical protein [Beijerinckiaceae bacterium]